MSKPLAQRVLLLGWDAADWQVARPLVETGRLPNLKRLIERGASGNVATLRPIISPILWNSIATGKLADKHDILGFVEPRPDGQGVRPVQSTSRRAKALWNILGQYGKRSCVVDWYASHPAEKIEGAIVTNFYRNCAPSHEPLPAACVHPPELLETLEKLRVTPGMLTPAQMACFFLDGLPEDDDPRLEAMALMVAQTASVHNAATWLAEAEDWDFLAVYYDMIDHCGHGFMEFRAPRLPHISERDFAIYGNIMDRVYEYHDLMLGRWLEIVGEETTIILLSDHGFFTGNLRPVEPDAAPFDPTVKGMRQSPLIWHRSQGMLVFSGPGIKTDMLLHGASLLDIAPTTLALLGLPVGEDMDGIPLTQIFAEPVTVEYVASHEPAHPRDGVWRDAPAEEADPWAAQEAVRQLAELGYVDFPEGEGPKMVQMAVEARQSNLVQVLSADGRNEEALVLLRQMLAAKETGSERAREVLCLLGLGRVAEAAAALERVRTLTPTHALMPLLTSWVALLEGRVEEAHELLLRAEETKENHPFVLLQLGSTYLRQCKWDSAEQVFRRVLELDEDSPEAHDGLGVALRETGRFGDAVYEHMRAASLQHDRAQTHVNLGIALTLDRQYAWAIRAFEVAGGLAPDEPFPHRCLARLHFTVTKDRARARVHAAEMLRRRARLRDRVPGLSLGA